MTLLKETIQRITENAKTHCPKMRVVNPFEGVRQGDVYIRQLKELPSGKLTPASTNQLAPGNTKGSRHTADGDVQVLEREGTTVLQGPIIVAKGGWTNGHPEHCNYAFGAGIFEVGYQQDLEQEELSAVRD